MSDALADFDHAGFWEDSEYALAEYVDVPVTDEVVTIVEDALGYRLPAAYIDLARHHNGGMPNRNCHRTSGRTSWADDHVALHGILSIGAAKPSSLLGEFGSAFWVTEWGYPPIGVYFADCPSAGHDMFCLDYRACGPTGEPTVVHIDQEGDYRLTPIAADFESFVRGLESEDQFDEA